MPLSNYPLFDEFKFGKKMELFGIAFYIGIAVLYLFPVTYLYRFSNRMRAGLLAIDQNLVTNAFGNLKSLFKFMGIMTIVILVIYLLFILFVVPMFMMTM
jgi:uncharacterized membrane protein